MARKIFFTLLLLLSVPLHLIAAPLELPKTGLTTCYDVAGVALPSCAGTGQDGEHQFGAAWPAPRFTDNNDGTVTDHLSGLIWLKDAHCADIQPNLPNAGLNWLGALSAANALSQPKCGLSPTDPGGWRLPNVSELESLIDISKTIPPLPADAPFVNFVNNADGSGPFTYWTSTLEAVFFTNALSVATFDGTVRGADRSTPQRIWPVRGTSATIAQSGQKTCWNPADGTVQACPAGADGAVTAGFPWPAPRFVDNLQANSTSDGTITDTLTGLTWLKKADCFGTTTTAQLALASTKVLASPACGLSDGSVAGNWRLPNRNEMRSIIDYDQKDGAAWLTTQGFINPQGGWYWTSDPFPNSTAWWMVKTEGGVWDSSTVATQGGTFVGGVQTLPPVTLLLPVRNTEQFITFPGATVTFGAGTLDLSALAAGGGSGNPVTFALASGPGTLSGLNGATLTITGAGPIVVTASQAGLGGYLPAADVQSTITVNKASATITLGALNQSYTGGALNATATTTPSGKNVTFTYDGNPAAPIEPGVYAVVATISDADFAGTASGNLTVSKATPVITWSTPVAILSGAALSATQLNATASVPGTFVYTPAIGAVPAVGTQTLSVTFTPSDSAHYTSKTATVLLTVNQSQTQSFTVTFASGGNGSLTGTLSQTVAAGASATSVTAVPATGYHFVQWTAAGGFSSTSNPLTLANVTASQSLTANFAVDTFLVTVSAPGGNGTISCTSPVNYGSDCVCTAVPDAGYHLLALLDNAADRRSAGSGNSYVITGVTGNHAVVATFARPNGIVIQSNGKTAPDLRDALAVLNLVTGAIPTTAADIARADIAPLGSDGRPAGDGHLDIYDVIGILRMLIGAL